MSRKVISMSLWHGTVDTIFARSMRTSGVGFLEAGFGPRSGPPQSVFETLDEAQEWVSMHVARARA